MESVRVAVTGTLDGESFPQSTVVEADSIVRSSPSVGAAKTGALTTRTDNDTGTFTMANGHGITTSQKVDLFWTGGQRRNMTATVTGNSVVLDGGSGDNLPVVTTGVTAMVPREEVFAVEGDDVKAVVAKSPRAGWIVFVDDEDAETAVYRFNGSGGYTWATGVPGLTANPLAGATIAKVKFSHGQTSAQVMTAAALFD